MSTGVNAGYQNAPASNAACDKTEQSLAKLITCLGSGSFLQEFARQCVVLSRADQVTMFTLEDGQLHHVFAHRPGQDELAFALCQRYLESFAGRDQILATRLQRRPAACATIIVRSDDIADSAYRLRLFTSAGLAGKIALLGTNTGKYCHLNFYLNFYYRDFTSDSYIAGSTCLGRIGPLLFELLRKQETLGGGLLVERSPRNRIARYLRERMPVLSKREAEVCAAILCGKSLQDISEELGLTSSTVRTFRRRAYGKLSIRRQSGLFARCAGLFVT